MRSVARCSPLRLRPVLAFARLPVETCDPLQAVWKALSQLQQHGHHSWLYLTVMSGRTRQWNLDIVGVEGVEAEAELLAAMITLFQRVGLGPHDVGIKVRLQASGPMPLLPKT